MVLVLPNRDWKTTSRKELTMPMMYIMRGVSGSGKTTEAKKLTGTIISTDDWFMVRGGSTSSTSDT